ncbi:aminoacyl-tRNA hydrolase [Patescibacteria group bacterium]|nr:aminoacyl-tRNA hydrolase [Patescibacteria group bacterium]
MKLIVGLGNPGSKYEKTRHNLGFMIAEKFLKDFKGIRETVWEDSQKFKSEISQIEWQPKHGKLEKIVLAKPKTYMNNSGLAVLLISQFFKIPPSEIWILYDEIDLPLGSMKIRFGGGHAGHKGIVSVIEKLGTDKFWRFRFGIGKSSKNQKLKNVDDSVLSTFREGEAGKARELIKKGSKAVAEALENGLDKAMNRFNTK